MNPCDSHLLEGHIGLVKIGTASWTDRSLIDSRRYHRSRLGLAEGCRAEGRGLGETVPQIHGLIQYQKALNSQLRSEFLPLPVPE